MAQNLERDEDMYAEINLYNNSLIIIKDGKMEVIEPPPHGHGKQTITWAAGKPINIENYFTKKI